MKVNDEQLLHYLANAYEMNNSLLESIKSLRNFELISNDKYHKLINIICLKASLTDVLTTLIKNKSLINYIIFFNHYYSLNQSITISLRILNITKKIKKDIINACIYPTLLIIMTTIALLFVSTYLLPQLIMINPNAGAKYKLIIRLLDTVPLIVLLVLAIIITAVLSFIFLFKKNFTKTLNLLLKIPLLNKLFITYITLKFALEFKEIIKNTKISKEAFEILAKQSRDLFIKYLTSYIQKKLFVGNSFNTIVKETPLLLNEFKQQLYLCRNSQHMALIIENYFNFKIDLINNSIKRIIAIGIPLIISTIGVLLILMYLLIMLPILDLSASI